MLPFIIDEGALPFENLDYLFVPNIQSAIEEGKTEFEMQIPNNYMLEIEQLGRCILDGEKPHVSHEFSIGNAEAIDIILKSCGY